MNEYKIIWLVEERYGDVHITQFDVVKETPKLLKLSNRQAVYGYPGFESQISKECDSIALSLAEAVEKAQALAQLVVKRIAQNLSDAIANAEKIKRFNC